MPATRNSFLLVLAVALVASLHNCEAGDEPIASVASASVAVQPILAATQLLPGASAPLEVPTTPTTEDATATHGKKASKSWSNNNWSNNKNWNSNWSRRSVTVTQFFKDNVWYSAWLSSLRRAVEVASIVPSMSTLLAAVTAAGVAGPLTDHTTTWTILAPTNDAFDDLLEALGVSATDLLNNKELLTRVLSYHVVPAAALNSGQLQEQAYATALNGKTVTVDKRPSGGVRITGGSATNVATVVVPNIRAGRSIIHVIDTVLVPSA